MRPALVWTLVIIALCVPLVAAAFSPLLQWRDPIYIFAGFAGITALSALVVQPVLAIALLPNLSPRRARRLHRLIGPTITIGVLLHIGGLWITSPPDVIDALLFRSPTPFSVWGMIALLALIGTASLARVKRRLPTRLWRSMHLTLAALIVACTILHAMLVDGTMEIVTKSAFCLILAVVTVRALVTKRAFHRP